MKSALHFMFVTILLCVSGTLYATEWMNQPLGARNVELIGAVSRDGNIYVAAPELASSAFQKNPESITSSGRDIFKLFDGDPNTFWGATSEVAEIVIDLGSDTLLEALEWDGFIYGETFPVSFEIWVMKTGNNFERLDNIKMLAPSGERFFTSGTVSDNQDSHGVRLEFGRQVSARKIMFKILKTSDGNSARLSKLAVLGDSGNSTATVTATFSPKKVEAWGDWRIDGQGITNAYFRFRASPDENWNNWSHLSEGVLKSLSSNHASELQIRVVLNNGTANGHSVLHSMAVLVDGEVAGPPEPLIPEQGGYVSAVRPRLLWNEGTQSEYLANSAYEVQISGDEVFGQNTTKLLRVSNNNTIEITDPPMVDVGGKVFWRVRRVLANGFGEWSGSSYFIREEIPTLRMNESEFGMNMGLDWRPWGEQLAVDAGFSWSRLNLPWYKLQGLDGSWDWSQTDLMFEVARRQNISVLGILGYTARQFSSAATGVSHIAPPVDIKPWIRYISEVTTRYRGDVAAWEIWNEHNHKGFYSGTPEEYAELLKTAYIAIKNISPNSLVTFGGHAGFSPRYLDAVVAKIGNDYWDFLNWHCYPAMPNEPYYQNWIDKVFGYLKERDLDKPVWLTEIGFSRKTDTDTDPDDYRISCLFVAHLAASKQVFPGKGKIEKIFPFQLVEGHGYGTVQQWAMVVDYANPSEPPKRLPVFKAHAHAVRLFDQVKWLSCEESNGLTIYRYQFNEQAPWVTVSVVWASSNDGDIKELQIAEGNDVEIRDVFGEVIQLPADRKLSVDSGVYFILSTKF